MPNQSFQFNMDPDHVAKLGEDMMRRWQETMTDAQTTASKSAECGNPMDAWSLQVEFGMRNAQRWFGWAGMDMNGFGPKKAAANPAGKPPAATTPPVKAPVTLAHPKPAPVPSTPTADAPSPKVVPMTADAPSPKVVPMTAVDTQAKPKPQFQPTLAPQVPKPVAPAPAAKTEAVANAAPPKAAEADELQRIRGIGPAIAKKLQAEGVGSFAQMAALDAAAIGKLDTALDLKGRIERDEWVAQAKALAAKS